MRLGGNIDWTDAFSTIAPQIRADGVHVWPFVSSFPIDITFQVFGDRQPVRMNRHDYFEIVYVVNGEITCQIAQRSFKCRQGELIVIGSSLYHRMWRHTRAHPRIATLFFMPEVICEAGSNGEETEFLMPFYLQEARFPHLVCDGTGIPSEAFRLFLRIHSALPASTGLARLSVRTYLRMILTLLVNHYDPYLAGLKVDNPRPQAERRIVPLFEFLEKHFNEALSVDDAAELLRISKPHFMRLFKHVTGQSFISYLNHFRVAKAQALLASSDIPIARLSQEIGFCDQSYFGSVFRRIVGMTPLTYRRRYGSSNLDMHAHSTVRDLADRSRERGGNPLPTWYYAAASPEGRSVG